MNRIAVGIALFVLVAAAAPTLAERLRRPVDARARRDAPGDFAELSGGLTYYQWHGPPRGPVVVCIHGLTTPSYVWDPIARALAAEGFRVLTYDLYGRGLSDRPEGDQDSDFFLRQLSELLADQEIGDHITLMGYSMGAAIATAYAAQHPELIDRMVLLAPTGLGHRLSGFAARAERLPVLGDWMMRLFGAAAHRAGSERDLPPGDEIREIAKRQRGEMGWRGTLSAVLSAQRHMLRENREDDHRQLGRTSLPVLAIWGEEDTTIPLTALGRMTQLNRNVRHVTLTGAGHALPYTHAPQVREALDEFLGRLMD